MITNDKAKKNIVQKDDDKKKNKDKKTVPKVIQK